MIQVICAPAFRVTLSRKEGRQRKKSSKWAMWFHTVIYALKKVEQGHGTASQLEGLQEEMGEVELSLE